MRRTNVSKHSIPHHFARVDHRHIQHIFMIACREPVNHIERSCNKCMRNIQHNADSHSHRIQDCDRPNDQCKSKSIPLHQNPRHHNKSDVNRNIHEIQYNQHRQKNEKTQGRTEDLDNAPGDNDICCLYMPVIQKRRARENDRGSPHYLQSRGPHDRETGYGKSNNRDSFIHYRIFEYCKNHKNNRKN